MVSALSRRHFLISTLAKGYSECRSKVSAVGKVSAGSVSIGSIRVAGVSVTAARIACVGVR